MENENQLLEYLRNNGQKRIINSILDTLSEYQKFDVDRCMTLSDIMVLVAHASAVFIATARAYEKTGCENAVKQLFFECVEEGLNSQKKSQISMRCEKTADMFGNATS